MKITIMQGTSGSGKSHWAYKLAADTGAMVLSTDNYQGLYNKDGSINLPVIGRAHGWCFREAIGALQAGHSIVIDNTNTTTLEIAPYMQLAQAFNTDVEIVRISCEREKALKRNVHSVPAHAHHGQAERLDAYEHAFHWSFIPGFTSREIEN